MLRAAAYCRVSTDKEDQVNSLESQKHYFAQYIARNPAWELGEVYVDEGITGTSTKKRAAFNRMIADAQSHRFDLILTKEISRFARNTLDSIFYTRKLRELGIGVIFMNDNINTLDPDAELRLTIMSSIAQEESRKTSERVKWGQKRRMEQGVVFGRDMLGYDVRDGKLYVNEAGAEVVRLIFRKYVEEEKGAYTIARELREAGISTAAHMKQWSDTVILRVLRNEKYCGDLIQKKTITANYLTHEKKYNRGEEEMVILRDHHQPIIARELFERAQRALARRAPSEEQRTKHTSRHCFSGKIQCAVCGSSFVSRNRTRKNGSQVRSWRCYQAARHGRAKMDRVGNAVGCDNCSWDERVLRQAMVELVKSLNLDRVAVTGELISAISKAFRAEHSDESMENTQRRIRQIDDKRQSLLELYLSKAISKADFIKNNTRYEAERQELQSRLEQAAQERREEEKESLLSAAASAVHGLAAGGDWDEVFYRGLIGRIAANRLELNIQLQGLEQSFDYRILHEGQFER